ncbi:hypothetical protein [Paenibacillus roseipurpureus]|uniref:Uncharacterized protein n=1 Tax=Paenibacillus roseopurpureus TaxID=2918901 RepID=A0AA96RNA6_9BACL|nr:hypothetical protein [Paenibacillus sp. MBLB1832]WNR45232.1 hypothetical protein MJB10_03600 [Paenibacillus sp. MBLB1832]
MLGNSIRQTENIVLGDLIGRDQYVIKTQEVLKASKPIRTDSSFDLKIDEDNSTLFKKLKDGKVNSFTKIRAVSSKLGAIKIIFELNKSENGKRILSDIYENLLTSVSKIVMPMDDGELLKHKSEDIFAQFPAIISRYKDIMEIDEAFLEGLLYIATSNCALRWKVDES